jgi:glycosyltransferase involved in cell wall biosynthesis
MKNDKLNVVYYPTPPVPEIAGISGGKRYHWTYGRSIGERVPSIRYIPPLLTDAYVNSLPPAHRPALPKPRKQQLAPWWRLWGVKRKLLVCVPRWLKLLLGYLKLVEQYRRLFREYAKDASLIHLSGSGCEVQTLAARLAGFKTVVTTVHCLPGTSKEANHWIRRIIERLSFWAGTHHICVSEATYEAWHQRVGLKRCDTTVIYNGCEPPVEIPSRKESRSAYGIDESRFVLGVAARLHELKGHNVLLDALYEVKQQLSPDVWSDWLLLVAGDGSLKGRLIKQAEDLGIGGQVKFLGHIESIDDFMSALDVHVLPSTSEALGLSIVEAMFCGIPNVVSDAGGMKEIVGRSGGGRVFESENRADLATCLIGLFGNEQERTREGELGRRFALEELTSDSMADKTIKVYEELT